MKFKLLKILNPALFLLVLIQGISVLMIKTGFAHEWLMEFHEFNGYAILILIAAHLFLNWNWIKANIFPKKTS